MSTVAVNSDLAEKRARQKIENLEQQNRELKAIIEFSTDGLYVTDGEGRTLLINQAYKDITGLSDEEVIGKNVRDLVNNGVFEKSGTVIALEQKQKVSIVQTIRGSKKLLITCNPILNVDGNVYRVVTSVRDVTKLHQAQNDLEISKKLTEQYHNEIIELRKQLATGAPTGKYLVAQSKDMQNVLAKIQKVAKLDVSILVTGETGVGKDMIVKLIHSLRGLPRQKLVSVNCNAIPESLFEAEFFGYEAGSFTGAKATGKKGLFDQADGGTLFLDEIADLPLFMQGKLLRVLQEKEFTRVGGEKTIGIDVHVIAATNRDLRQMVEKGEFRQDLFYRLNVFPIYIPPLRERREDIWEMAVLFLKEYNEKYKMNKRFSRDALDSFLYYYWPGNVRELRNVIEQLVLLTEGDIVTEKDIPENIADVREEITVKVNSVLTLKRANYIVEEALIAKALQESGSIRKAAEKLGVHYSTIAKKLKAKKH